MSKIIKSFIGSLSATGQNVQQISCEEFAGDQRKAQVFGPANVDFSPPEGTETININLGNGRAFLVSIAYHNQKIEPVALPGEQRIYSTPADGSEVKAEIHLKQDGEIYATNGAVTIIAKPDGTLTVECDSDINISNPGGSVELTETGQLSIETLLDITAANPGGIATLTPAGIASLQANSSVSLYAGPVLTPAAFITVDAAGTIQITASTSLGLNTGNINFVGILNMTGAVNITGNVATTGTLTNNAVNVGSTHVHGGIAKGKKDTEVPK
jgi:hypothetical protein